MSRSSTASTALAAAVALLATTAVAAAGRPMLAGRGPCAGAEGRYLAAVADGRARVVSAAPFPGGAPAGGGADIADPGDGSLWLATVDGMTPQTTGCVAFDKDRFTWPGDLTSYVRYLVDELLSPAQRLDSRQRLLEVGRRTVRLEVSRPGSDTALLVGPEGAMLGYGRLADEERYFFLPVILGDGETLLLRVLRNRGAPFGERTTEALGFALLRQGEATDVPLGPGFLVSAEIAEG